MLDKCNFTAHAWCEHNVTMFGITKKKVTGEKGRKNVLVSWVSFQYCSCSHFFFRILWNKCWISQESKDALWLLPGVQQAGKICELQQRQNKVQCRNARCCHSHSYPWVGQGCPSKFHFDLYRLSLEPLDMICLLLEHTDRPWEDFMLLPKSFLLHRTDLLLPGRIAILALSTSSRHRPLHCTSTHFQQRKGKVIYMTSKLEVK